MSESKLNREPDVMFQNLLSDLKPDWWPLYPDSPRYAAQQLPTNRLEKKKGGETSGGGGGGGRMRTERKKLEEESRSRTRETEMKTEAERKE